MQIQLFKNIINEIKNINISDFINEISERIEQMEQKLVMDRIENNIAICEDKKTGEIIEVEKIYLPQNIKEGDIIKKEKEIYIKDIQEQEKVEKRIKDKMDKLWKD